MDIKLCCKLNFNTNLIRLLRDIVDRKKEEQKKQKRKENTYVRVNGVFILARRSTRFRVKIYGKRRFQIWRQKPPRGSGGGAVRSIG